MTAETVEAQHGPDCTCPVVTRIETVLVAVADGCPGDRNPHRGAQVAARLDDAELTPEQIAEWDRHWNAMLANGTDPNIVLLPGRFWRTEPRAIEYPVGGSATDVPSA